MLLFKALFFSASPVFAVETPFTGAGYAAIVIIGIAAIYGHAYPLYYRFRGGGSIGVLFRMLAVPDLSAITLLYGHRLSYRENIFSEP
ncbi:MAG: glycerol-3-phosphate acyltransferase [Candidatus Marinimicrobia bacterium]|nr:glycerol-3-phosphate acyltransferase [Candidatus Neomarinimicrobiota bacterium]